MFGYITPNEGELKVKELQLYKSVYCGLCKRMGKRVCPESRMTLSYDIVFLALVRFLLSEEKLSFKKGRCALSPLKKRVIMAENESLNYCSAVGSLLAYHNVLDDVNDSEGIKKLVSKLVLLFLKRARKKAGLNNLDEIIADKLKDLNNEEKSGSCTLDSCAHIFGELLSEVFKYGYDSNDAVIASEIGYHVGKWIYMADACDDYEKDIKNGEFNPIKDFNRERLGVTLTLALEGAEKALMLINPYDEGIMNLVKNIIYLGMPDKINKILSSEKEEKS